MSNRDTTMTHASEHQCCEDNCEQQAVAFWPACDPDIPSHPYCRECLDRRKNKVMEMMFHISDMRGGEIE